MHLNNIIKSAKSILIVYFLLICLVVKAQLPDYPTRIKQLSSAIQKKLSDTKTGLYFETTDSAKRENLHSWLWPLCAYIQAANEMEKLALRMQFMQPVEKAIDQYYSDQPPLPAYQDYPIKERLSSRFYDDNQWIAIAYLDAYNRKHEKRYLDKAKMICRFMLNGLDTVTGGGIYWKEGDFKTKNTCSNGPGILVLLQLYKITHKVYYLNTASAVYQWTNKYLQSPDGVYYDNINTESRKVNKATYTYNTGTMLQANVLLYEITHNKQYLIEAKRIAAAGRKHFFKDGRLPGNSYWFNAVMLRGYEELYKVDKDKSWINFFKQDADAIWNTERDADNLLGAKPVKSLIDQAAMIEIYARLQAIEAK